MENDQFIREARKAAITILSRHSIISQEDRPEGESKNLQNLFYKIIELAIKDIGVYYNAITYLRSNMFINDAEAIELDGKWFLNLLEESGFLSGNQKTSVNLRVVANPSPRIGTLGEKIRRRGCAVK